MKKILVTLLCLVHCAWCIDLLAIPAKPIIKTLTLSDGSQVQARLMGDENYHYYETLDGRIVQTVDNRLQIVDRSLQNAGVVVDNPKRRIHPSVQNLHSQLSILSSKAQRTSVLNSQRVPHHAERGLVILVEFSDVSFVKARQDFDDLLNKDGYNYNGAIGSAMNYFKDASNGAYVPKFDLFGPYKLDREMSYYGENNRDGLDKHPDQMVVDAMMKLAADTVVNLDFTEYDTNNDGILDNIFIYYAGYGENEGAPDETVWPHAWEIFPEFVEGQLYYDGKLLHRYACTSELQDSRGQVMCGIGTFCHEFSHVLGLPDFYVTDYLATHKTLGDWDVMDAGAYLNNGNTPPTYSAHERFYLGWLTPEILNENGEYKLEELQKSNKAYIITESGNHNLDGGDPSPYAYFLLENRQKTGWDRYIPGHGLMITKTVYDANNWYNNRPNNTKNNQGYDLIEADGKAPNGHTGKAGDLFPGSALVTEYAPFANAKITNISETMGVIDFVFDCVYNGETGVENNASDVVLVTSGDVGQLVGVTEGDVVRCYDAIGRQLWHVCAEQNIVTFEKPNSLYVIHIVRGDERLVIKGI